MPYRSNQELPEQIKGLPSAAQTIWRKVFNASVGEYGEERAFKIAWASIKKSYKKVGDKWVKKVTKLSTLYQVELSTESKEKEEDTFQQQVLKLGRWTKKSAKGGIWECTKETVKKIIDNFKKGVYGKKIPVTLGHPFPVDSAGENSGEVIELVETDDGMDAIYKVNPKIAKKIKGKEIEEVSPTINESLFSPDLDKSVGPAITGLALVNGPFQKDMREAVALSNQDYNIVQLSLEGDTMAEEKKEEKKEETKETKTEEKEGIVKEVEKKVEEDKEKSSNEDKKATKSEVKSSEKEEEAKPQEPKPTSKPKTNKEFAEALAKSEGTVAELKRANRLADAKGKVKEFTSKGKLTPAEENIALSIAASNTEVVNLSNDKTEKIGDMFFKFIGDRKPVVELSAEAGVVDAGGQLATKPSESEQSFVDSAMQGLGHITDPKERKAEEDKARKAYKEGQKIVKQFRKKE